MEFFRKGSGLSHKIWFKCQDGIHLCWFAGYFFVGGAHMYARQQGVSSTFNFKQATEAPPIGKIHPFQ